MLGEKDLLFLGCMIAQIAGYMAVYLKSDDMYNRFQTLALLTGEELNITDANGNPINIEKYKLLNDFKELHKKIYYDTRKTF